MKWENEKSNNRLEKIISMAMKIVSLTIDTKRISMMWVWYIFINPKSIL